jgi:hypothetical protein
MGKYAETRDGIELGGGQIEIMDVLKYDRDVGEMTIFGLTDLNHVFSIINGGNRALGAYGMKQERE